MAGFLYKSINRSTPQIVVEEPSFSPLPVVTTTPVANPVTTKPAEKKQTSVFLPSTTKKRGSVVSDNINLGNMQWFKDLLEEEGINGRITSGLRPGAKTSTGKTSHHATGDAVDLVAADGEDLNSLYDAMLKNTKIIKALQDRGYGVLRETTDGALKRTGGTGYHYHIGKDQSAVEDLNRGLQGLGPLFAKRGTKLDYEPVEREEKLTDYMNYYTPEYNMEAPEDGIVDWAKDAVKAIAKKVRKVTPAAQKAPVDWSKVRTTNDRPINIDYINKIVENLNGSQLNNYQKSAILANIIEESGGNPMAVDKTHRFQGLLQWGADRYIPNWKNDDLTEIDSQMKYIYDTIANSEDQKSWTHGGTGSGYMKAVDAMNRFSNAQSLDDATHSFVWGYVRPTGKQDSYNNRRRVAEDVYNLLYNED